VLGEGDFDFLLELVVGGGECVSCFSALLLPT